MTYVYRKLLSQRDRQLHSGFHAGGISDARTCNIKGSAVIGRGADEGKADGGVNSPVKGQLFHGD